MSGELARAQKRQADAAEQGFDWPDLDGVWAKLAEEIAELQAAGNQAQRCEELGDLMFMVVNLARHLDVEPAAALGAATDKFERRFAHVMAAETLPLLGDERRLAAMEERWQAAKRLERGVEGGQKSSD